MEEVDFVPDYEYEDTDDMTQVDGIEPGEEGDDMQPLDENQQAEQANNNTDVNSNIAHPDTPSLVTMAPEKTGGRRGHSGLQSCPQEGCDHKTRKMKRHVVRYHICDGQWWALYPLMVCWTCEKLEISTHIKSHGPHQRPDAVSLPL